MSPTSESRVRGGNIARTDPIRVLGIVQALVEMDAITPP
jgi:hypothetical protein